MRTTFNAYGEDDHDLVRRFAIREDGTAKYPIAAACERAGNVVDLAEYRRQISAGSVARKIGG
jgi:hypothetical protein